MFQIHDQVTLESGFARRIGLSGDGYGRGFVDEIATATGVIAPEGSALYHVTWYRRNDRPGVRHIFREGELVPPCSETQCRNPGHSSMDCYPRYAELEYEGPSGPEIMTRDEWERVGR